MAKSIYKYETSKTAKTSEIKAAFADRSPGSSGSFFCNSLEEKRNYYYFQAGPWGAPGYQCGRTARKINKNEVASHQVADQCQNGWTIYKVFLN